MSIKKFVRFIKILMTSRSYNENNIEINLLSNRNFDRISSIMHYYCMGYNSLVDNASACRAEDREFKSEQYQKYWVLVCYPTTKFFS